MHLHVGASVVAHFYFYPFVPISGPYIALHASSFSFYTLARTFVHTHSQARKKGKETILLEKEHLTVIITTVFCRDNFGECTVVARHVMLQLHKVADLATCMQGTTNYKDGSLFSGPMHH